MGDGSGDGSGYGKRRALRLLWASPFGLGDLAGPAPVPPGQVGPLQRGVVPPRRLPARHAHRVGGVRARVRRRGRAGGAGLLMTMSAFWHRDD